MKKLILAAATLCSSAAYSASNVVVVTIDGLRWQEVFSGADSKLIEHKDFVKNPAQLKQAYWDDNAQTRREKLMPFLWQTIAKQGVVVGNRELGSKMSVVNSWYFSYPGYNEIFTGQADPEIDSNALENNKNATFLEWLNNKPEYGQKLAAFGSWDAFPYIFNEQRSGLYVNATFDSYHIQPQSAEMALLNELQAQTPSPWQNVRTDSFTYRFAKEYLTHIQPKAMVISLGETDDFAHEGHYDRYLHATKRTDAYLADLWHTIQSTPGYRNNTTLLIVTDHGRGYNADDWQHHASKKAVSGYMKKLSHFEQGIIGADEIWMAAIGPDIKPLGELKAHKEFKQDQIAATALTILGENPQQFNPQAGKAIKEIIKL